jgi:acyl-ACP thioesterase
MKKEFMKPVWEETFIVRSYDVDPGWKLKLSAFFCYMQEAAVNHSYDLGVGYHDLEKYGVFWVLSRIKLKIKRMPSWGEAITIETWPKGKDRLFALRDFVALDSNNNEIISVTSLWLLIKKENHRPQRIQSLPSPLPENEGISAFDEQLGKIKPLDNLEQKYEREVMTNDLDVNYHVNNARYIDWVLDCFDPLFNVSNSIGNIQINYMDEAKHKDKIIINTSKHTDLNHIYYIEGINKDLRSVVFQALLEWDKK